MKSILQKIATAAMLAVLGALAAAGLVFASAPQTIAPFSEALRMHRQQDQNTLEAFSRQILRPPPGPANSGGSKPGPGAAATPAGSVSQ